MREAGASVSLIAAGIDPRCSEPLHVEPREFGDLVTFVAGALLDPRVFEFCDLVPESLPSGFPVAHFEGCER